MTEDDVRTFSAERRGDFSTDKMVYKCTERHAQAFVDPRALHPTIVVYNEYEGLAREMQRVVTPYAPCTDLKHE